MAFNKVQTQAEAVAFNFLQDQSTVLRTEETNEIDVHAVNVITKTPEVGDVLCVTNKYNAAGTEPLPADQQEIVWIKGDSVSYAHWPTANDRFIFNPVGVCYKVRGGKAYCRFHTEVSRRWSEADRWLVNAAGTTTISNMNGSVNITVKATTGCSQTTVSVTDCVAGNLANNCKRIQAALCSISGNTAVSCQYVGPHDYDPVDSDGQYTGNDGVVIFNCRFTADAWNTLTFKVGSTTITTSRCIGRDIPADSTNYRANGGQQYWGGCNYPRFYDYYSVNGRSYASGAAYPTSHIETDTPLSEAAFNENPQAAIFRNAYGTYEAYLKSCMCEWPTNKGANGRFFDKGKEFTQKLAKAVYIDMSRAADGGSERGTGAGYVTYLYGPAHYCNVEVSVNGPGLTSGNWWLPSSGEMIELMQDITYGTSAYQYDTRYDESDPRYYASPSLDPVNRAIYHLNDNTFDETQGFRFISRYITSVRHTSTPSHYTSTYFQILTIPGQGATWRNNICGYNGVNFYSSAVVSVSHQVSLMQHRDLHLVLYGLLEDGQHQHHGTLNVCSYIMVLVKQYSNYLHGIIEEYMLDFQ